MDDLIAKELAVTKEASDRGRWVLLVMQIACIVIFMAAWHEMPWGWGYSRLRTLQAAVWLFDCSDEKHPELDGKATASELEKTKHDACHYLPASKNSGCTRTPQQPFCADEVNHARTLLNQTLLTPLGARKSLETLQASNSDRIMNVSVPFLGITFDINDLGLLGGITFTLLLTWFYFSLKREGENVTIAFAKKSEDDLAAVYRLLSMTQVLTITPEAKVGRHRWVQYSWLFLERSLVLSPIFVQGVVVLIDYVTASPAQEINPGFVRIELYLERFFLVIMLALTVSCWGNVSKIDREWESAYKRLANSDGERA